MEGQERKKGAILSYITIILSIAIQLCYTPFLIRKLGQSEFGLYSLISSVIGYLTILDFGFGNALIVFTSKLKSKNEEQKIKKIHGMFKLIYMIIGIICVIMGAILYLNVNNLFGKTMSNIELQKSKIMLIILIFNLAMTFIFNIYGTLITAYEKFTFQKILGIVSIILKPLIMIPLLMLGFKSITLTLVITIVNLLVILCNFLYCKLKLKVNVKYQGFDKKIFKNIIGFSIFIFIEFIVEQINWSIDNFVLGAVSGTIAVSLYSVAAQINRLFISFSGAINGIMISKTNKMIADNVGNEAINQELIKTGRIQTYVLFLLCSGFVLFGKEFICIWAGKEFEVSYYIALILIIPLCLTLIQGLTKLIAQGKNKHKFGAIMLVIVALINVVISVPLAKLYGGIGSAIGTSISLIVGNIFILDIYYQRSLKLNMIKFWKEIIKMVIPYLIPILIIIFVKKIFVLNGFIGLIIYGTVYTIMYALVSYFIVMNDYEKNMILDLKRH